MKNSKLMKELVPIAALLLFIIVVLVMCAVSARQKKGQSGTGPDTEAVQETESETESGGETAESTEEASGETGENTGKEDPVEVQETIELDAEEPVETESAPDAVKDAPPAVSGSNVPGTAQVSANTAMVIVKKTNTQMLAEMMDYWQKDNVEAVEDLSGLAHYRAMSASLKSSAYFYYYGDRNEQGRPEGTGIAVYGEDQYYYGEWKDGLRSGKGMWLKMYCQDNAAASFDPVLVTHSYEGAWLDNLPNGEGQEHYDLDINRAAPESRYFQNVIGNFKDGLYHGNMYINTLNADGNVQEWRGEAKEGVFKTFEGRDLEGRVPICQDVQNPDSHMWIHPLENKDQGLKEVRVQVKNRKE